MNRAEALGVDGAVFARLAVYATNQVGSDIRFFHGSELDKIVQQATGATARRTVGNCLKGTAVRTCPVGLLDRRAREARLRPWAWQGYLPAPVPRSGEK